MQMKGYFKGTKEYIIKDKLCVGLKLWHDQLDIVSLLLLFNLKDIIATLGQKSGLCKFG